MTTSSIQKTLLVDEEDENKAQHKQAEPKNIRHLQFCDDIPELTKANCASVDVDQVWEFLGKYGCYQTTMALLLFVSLTTQAFAILSGVFTGMSVNFQCETSEISEHLSEMQYPNDSFTVTEECAVKLVHNSSTGLQVLHTHECTSFVYVDRVVTSFIAEWNLVCDSETLSQLPQMLTMFGMMVGAMTLPSVGDRFGRRVQNLISHFGHLCVCISLSFVSSFKLFLVLKFFSGVFNQGLMITSFIHLMELLPTNQRTVIGFLATCMWVTSVLLMMPFAFIFRGYNWRTLQLAFSLASLTCFTLLFLDESLRWLLANKKVKRAKKVLQKACKMNNKSYNSLLKVVLKERTTDVNVPTGENYTHQAIITEDIKEKTPGDGSAEKSKKLIKDIFRRKIMRNISCIVIYSWMVASITYYGITLLSTSLAGDPYINFLISGLLEIPSAVWLLFMFKRFGRKKSTMVFNCGAGICLIAATLVVTISENNYSLALVQTGLTLIGKFCIAASFNGLWIWTPEIYPTNIRNVGVGMASTGARLAASASPFFNLLARKAIWAPGTLCACTCFLCAFLLTYLPETSHRELPRTISEIEDWLHSDRKQIESPEDTLNSLNNFKTVPQDEASCDDNVCNKIV